MTNEEKLNKIKELCEEYKQETLNKYQEIDSLTKELSFKELTEDQLKELLDNIAIPTNCFLVSSFPNTTNRHSRVVTPAYEEDGKTIKELVPGDSCAVVYAWEGDDLLPKDFTLKKLYKKFPTLEKDFEKYKK